MSFVLLCSREYNKKHVKKELKKQRDQLVKSWRILDTIGNGILTIMLTIFFFTVSVELV